MNERIVKLFMESVDSNYIPLPIEDHIPSWTEKFAELIVKVCADICNKIYFDRYPDAEDWERSEEGDAIKKHFGVEL